MNLIQPWRRMVSVDRIDLDALRDAGIRCILLDRDNTCVPRDTNVLPESVAAWFQEAKDKGFALCMVSNNFHSSQVAASAVEVGCAKVDHAMKPAPFALWKAMDLMGVAPEQTVLVGDQLFTDCLGANLAGIRAIVVKPQSREDLWYTQIFRIFEDKLAPDAHFSQDWVTLDE